MGSLVGERLLSVAALVREGSVIADIGTDHAYLPIYLFGRGKISFAYLTDINEGPLMRARENIEKNALVDKTELFLTDGTEAIDDLAIDDYIIAGMGGELISGIIEKSRGVRRGGARLILQPMSKHTELREYLFSSGFDIQTESYSLEDGKVYLALLSEYRGEKIPYTDFDIYFGKSPEAALKTEAGTEYIRRRAAALDRIIEGKRQGGACAAREISVRNLLRERFSI